MLGNRLLDNGHSINVWTLVRNTTENIHEDSLLLVVLLIIVSLICGIGSYIYSRPSGEISMLKF